MGRRCVWCHALLCAEPYAESNLRLSRRREGGQSARPVSREPDFPRANLTLHNVLPTAHWRFIPKGCAHGFQTLAADSVIQHCISTPDIPEAGRGIRRNGPAIAVIRPQAEPILSERNRNLPLLAAFAAA